MRRGRTRRRRAVFQPRGALRIASALLLGLAGCARLPAQETVLLAPRIEAFWEGTDGALHVQAGSRLLRLGESLEQSMELPDGIRFFDRGGRLELVDAAGSSLSPPFRPQAPWMRFPSREPPARLPLLLGRDGRWVPGRGAHGFFDGEAWRTVEPAAGGRADVGWGIGDTMEVVEALPHALSWPSPSGEPRLLLGLGAAFLLHARSGTRPLPAPPGDGEDGILGFPYEIPPLLGRFGPGGSPMLLLCDPSAGSAALLGDPFAADPPRPRIWLAGGLLLAAWAVPGEGGDGLVLLRASRPALLDQLRIIESGSLRAEALFYPRASDGTYPASPAHRIPVPLDLSISIRNEVRRGRFLSLAHPFSGGMLRLGSDGSWALLSPGGETSEGKIRPGEPPSPFAAFLRSGCIHVHWRSPDACRILRFVR